MKAALNRLVSRAASSLRRGRRRRFDHPEAHRAARPDQYADVSNLYRPFSPNAGGLR